MLTMKKINICGVSFNNISAEELKDAIEERLSGDGRNYFIVTPNVDFIVRANSNASFRDILNKADLSLCDSAIVKMASPFLGKKIQERITGFDLLRIICSNLKRENNCFILGGKQDIVTISAERLKLNYPDIKIAGFHHGYFEERKDRGIIDLINTANTDILIIGMGSPKQELWVAKNKKFLKVRIIICIGGIIDILAGKTRRAPRWMQRIGLEWFWRLIQEPKRLWKRYLIDDMKFFSLVLKEKIKIKQGKA